MSTSKYARIVERLVEKTNKGELDWKETPGGSGYQVSFPDYSLIIYETVNGQFPNENDYLISIVNSEGDVLDHFSDIDLDSAEGRTGSEIKYYPMLKELYNQVRRQALGVDKALDAILHELEDT
jgi:hypothetical protein